MKAGKLRRLGSRVKAGLGNRLGKGRPRLFSHFALDGKELEPHRSQLPGPLERSFYRHRGRVAHKWLHYLPVYDRLFARFRGRDVTIIEIGVNRGGSLELWRDFFGPGARIVGIDIDPACAERVSPPSRVMIGSQDDPEFLERVVAETGPPDIVLDDGSHVGRHQIASFRALFPALRDGGLYLIEDLQTSYLEGVHEGGYGRPGTGVEFLKSLIDDMHGWYHDEPHWRLARDRIGSIRIFDGIAAIEKIPPKIRPGHYRSGRVSGN
ncbi:MAG: class I SAM-dependent methyltransferase [Sphingomonadaceae bacterium]